MKGIVNWYNDEKRHGLIESQDGKIVMVYDKDIPFLTILHPGDQVEFNVEKTSTGLKAINIKEIVTKIYI